MRLKDCAIVAIHFYMPMLPPAGVTFKHLTRASTDTLGVAGLTSTSVIGILTHRIALRDAGVTTGKIATGSTFSGIGARASVDAFRRARFTHIVERCKIIARTSRYARAREIIATA